MIIVLLSHGTDRAASAEPSLLELCRDALEEDESQSTESTEIINSHTDLTDLWGPAEIAEIAEILVTGIGICPNFMLCNCISFSCSISSL